ncbi:MAG TPA: 50S ribosomal protein L24 [Candidatus Sabulitectum sp.]|jgi:large subunit ribosomal protein L24|nr:50S ribosomal protein L24 [Candidatus Sabulitectum sp.]HPF31513.1 50S ribosomal protein L24 [Candidatus Sabulitectum sp.]HPJ27954.1 50S ribosomal protein L24 [Candidatus Sabulitectum sp.]HPR21757.1 50S ribosomal protein L24 [Candidatus Sabulitectum sp.]HRW78783.1 50S ribosomal protein L24 [Candidatus Sabulitectum sp.]
MHVKKGDKVKVLSGNERGKTGKILKVFPGSERAIVEGLNLIKRHTRPSQKNQQGGIIEREAPIHVSNLRLICPGCGKATGISHDRDAEGRLMRVCKACGETIATG